jgi:alanyl-tRNA synthetase
MCQSKLGESELCSTQFIAGPSCVCDNLGIESSKNEADVSGKGTQQKMTGNETREKFLQFFEGRGHRRVRSSSLVPHGDATLLFTNAGMNQFKDVFLGLEKRDYSRATTSQKCVRAGGKHNDLENVGFTKRHHTFFEMLGNFSFGDYFKKDAVAYAWELMTSPEWFGIPKDKLYVTIFEGAIIPGADIPRDNQAYDFWLAQGVPAERIFALGMNENFWQMGDTGPCGPCSEIHYDMGPAASELGHVDCRFPCDCGRYVEIWNLVFMQYDRQAGVDDKGVSWSEFGLLPSPCVDTGMGLERVAAVLQGVISNYDTDFFVPLMKRAAELCGVDYAKEIGSEAGKGGAASLRVIADHARSVAFLITDGVLPSNEGRGYVLRKIMRRAFRHARLLGQKQPVVLTEMVHVVQRMMESAYPELRGPSFAHVPQVVHAEEVRFARSLETALERLESDLRPLTAFVGTPFQEKEGVYLGEKAFQLYDTYGLPLDFILDSARDLGIPFDQVGFDRAMQEQRGRARRGRAGRKKRRIRRLRSWQRRSGRSRRFITGQVRKIAGLKRSLQRAARSTS